MITGIIVVKNEIETYKKSIQSIYSFVDELIVGDVGMDRQMRDHLEGLKKVRLVTFKEYVPFADVIKQGLMEKAKGDWILLLDPDEEMPDKLLEYLDDKKHNFDYFVIPRKNNILGHWMQHSKWWPDTQVRFFKKGAVTWSKNVHTQPRVEGQEHQVPHEEKYAIIHTNFHTYDQYLEKSARYAKAEAKQLGEAGDLTLWKALKLGISEFVARYYVHDGYKDGMHGFVMAFSQMMYYFQVYVYYWESHKYAASPPSNSLSVDFFAHGLHEILHWTNARNIPHRLSSLLKRKVMSSMLKN